MQSIELEHEGLEIKFYETTTEHAKDFGFKASKPIFFKHISVDKKKRNKGNGTQLLKMVQEYAEHNGFDLIFGTIPKNAEFSRDSRWTPFSDVEMIKNFLFTNGYAINPDNNDFHKVIQIQKPLKPFNGIGFKNCTETGVYEVTTEIENKIFTKFSEAKSFYDETKGEKAIWDVSKNDFELLDARYRK